MWCWISFPFFCLFRSTRPKLTLEILVYLFFSAAFGYSHWSLGHTSWQLGQYFLMCELFCLIHFFSFVLSSAALSQYTFFYGLQYTTATFAITFTNMAPVLTFLIAVLLRCSRIQTFFISCFWSSCAVWNPGIHTSFRVESLNMKNKAGAAKIIGTLMSFAGVMLLTLYKGVALTHQAEPSESPDHAAESGKKSWTLGTVALLANCLCFSFWLLLQSKLTKKYPALYSSTAYMFLISSLQGGGLTAAIQRRASVWVLTRPLEIVAVLYTVRFPLSLSIGIFTLLLFLLIKWPWIHAWCTWSPYSTLINCKVAFSDKDAAMRSLKLNNGTKSSFLA